MSDIYTGRPVRFNNVVKENPQPEGINGEGFFVTQLSSVVGLARKKLSMAAAICYFLLRYRIYGNYG